MYILEKYQNIFMLMTAENLKSEMLGDREIWLKDTSHSVHIVWFTRKSWSSCCHIFFLELQMWIVKCIYQIQANSSLHHIYTATKSTPTVSWAGVFACTLEKTFWVLCSSPFLGLAWRQTPQPSLMELSPSCQNAISSPVIKGCNQDNMH